MYQGTGPRLTPVVQRTNPAETRRQVDPDIASAGSAHQEEIDEFDLMQFVGVIWRAKWIIVFCALLAALLGGYYAFKVAEPQYAATARLALQVRNQQVVDLESVISGVSTEQASINTELEVIRSRGLIQRLVTDLNLIEDAEFNPTLQTTPALSVAGIKLAIKRLFRVDEPVGPPPTSAEVRLQVGDAVLDSIAVSAQRNTYLFDIGVTTDDPHKSAAMANRLARIYLDDQIEIKFAATEYAVDWLSGRVTELELELKLKEDAIKELRAETELVSLDALEALNIRAKDIRERLTEAQVAVTVASERLQKTMGITEGGDFVEIAGAMADPTLNRLVDAAVRGNTTAEDAFRERLDSLVQRDQSNVDRTIAQRDALQTSYDRIQEQIDSQNVDLVQLNQLVREADATRVLYETFLTRLKETSVQIGLQQADSRILSEAVPGHLVAPRKTRIVGLALILGGMIGVGIALLRHMLNDGFRTSEDLERATRYTVLGQIPRIPIRRRKGLVEYLTTKPTSAAAEAVRNLRTSVLLSDVDNPPKVIMSTSSVPGEGKTTQAIALSHNLSGLGKRVLLIEGDIRRRTFTQYFRQESPGGLVSVVTGEKTLDEAVLHEPDVGADILMGEKSSINAADLFSSEKFHKFLDDARAAYDFIIIDTPPVLVVPDARVIGRLADVIIYTVCWDRTHRSQVIDGLRQFSSVGLHVAGLVLSQIDPRGMKRYGYGGRYGAYSGYGIGYYDT